MRRHPAALGGPQLVRQRLGERLHPGLRHVVGRVPRRRGDALLRPGAQDRPVPPPRRHPRPEGLHGVDHPQKVDPQDRVPGAAEAIRARPDPGIGHQHIGLDLGRQRVERRPVAHVDLARHRPGADRRRRRRQPLGPEIGDHHPHPQRREPAGRGQPDPRRAAGNHRRRPGPECGMGHRKSSLASVRRHSSRPAVRLKRPAGRRPSRPAPAGPPRSGHRPRPRPGRTSRNGCRP